MRNYRSLKAMRELAINNQPLGCDTAVFEPVDCIGRHQPKNSSAAYHLYQGTETGNIYLAAQCVKPCNMGHILGYREKAIMRDLASMATSYEAGYTLDTYADHKGSSFSVAHVDHAGYRVVG